MINEELSKETTKFFLLLRKTYINLVFACTFNTTPNNSLLHSNLSRNITSSCLHFTLHTQIIQSIMPAQTPYKTARIISYENKVYYNLPSIPQLEISCVLDEGQIPNGWQCLQCESFNLYKKGEGKISNETSGPSHQTRYCFNKRCLPTKFFLRNQTPVEKVNVIKSLIERAFAVFNERLNKLGRVS